MNLTMMVVLGVVGLAWLLLWLLGRAAARGDPTGRRAAAAKGCGLGFLLCLLAVVPLAWTLWTKTREALQQAQGRPETVQTVVAVRDLYMGVPISQEDVTVVKLPPDLVPRDSAFWSVDEVVGRTPRERILANEVVRDQRLARRDVGMGLNAVVTGGRRAVSLRLASWRTVEGALRPNNYIDALVRLPEVDEAGRVLGARDCVLQGLRVLAVDGQLLGEELVRHEQGAAQVVTLEATPEQALVLGRGASEGDVQLQLRSDVDIVQVELLGVVDVIPWPHGPDSQRTVTGRVQPGHAQVTLRLDEVQQGGGWLTPGGVASLGFDLEPSLDGQPAALACVLPDVQVLAVDGAIYSDRKSLVCPGRVSTVTLEVAPATKGWLEERLVDGSLTLRSSAQVAWEEIVLEPLPAGQSFGDEEDHLVTAAISSSGPMVGWPLPDQEPILVVELPAEEEGASGSECSLGAAKVAAVDGRLAVSDQERLCERTASSVSLWLTPHQASVLARGVPAWRLLPPSEEPPKLEPCP